MKNIISKSIGAVVLTGVLFTVNGGIAQSADMISTTTTAGATSAMGTTTSMGTISEFGPDRIIIRSETSPDPIRYTSSKTTTYVDENGKAVSVETVKSGVPVTVYYTKTGDGMVADKVIVRKVTTTQE